MIVVSNTSPLTNLAAIGQFELLRQLYDSVHIPVGVWEELNAQEKRWPGADAVDASEWIDRHVVRDQILVTALRRDLGRGEAEAIALATELGAELILLDEKEGRHAAQRLGLRAIGVVGILIDAKARGAVVSVRPLLDALRRVAGFYLSDTLYDSVLEIAHESHG